MQESAVRNETMDGGPTGMTNEYKIEYIQRKNDVMDFLNQSIQVMEALEKKEGKSKLDDN